VIQTYSTAGRFSDSFDEKGELPDETGEPGGEWSVSDRQEGAENHNEKNVYPLFPNFAIITEGRSLRIVHSFGKRSGGN
jgi:hypothetical protein